MNERRRFLRVAGLGGLAAMAGSALSLVVLAAGQADALLLSCMDYRLLDAIGRYMNARGLAQKYDHFILAGASLGAVTDKYPDWNRAFWEHLGVAIDLHGIHKVIVVDHRDCGAYKVILGDDLAKDPAKETAVHARNPRALRDRIKAKHQTLEVELALMNLKGKVEAIS
jgi:carbonic anhydrase